MCVYGREVLPLVEEVVHQVTIRWERVGENWIEDLQGHADHFLH